ncbi:MAG: hypothetical protein BGO25_05790 [Acidobacteriales bacterium 59-55]|nr:hypothetical protein [Terriglobales bacterium]OJV44594.1 MAG: hypothetical protein BGO25_05790 [Acidobacteriales bacterium 59-55]
MRISLFFALLFISILPAHATNWYIRADGGDLTQCSGQVDAAYSASIINKQCALNDYRLLAYPGKGGYATAGKWIVQGGDTIYIGAGQFRVGYNGPNSTDHNGLSSAGNPFGSAMPAIPSGTAAQPTRIIGAGVALSQIYGGYGAGNVINLAGSSFVEISGLELTDHAQCTRVGGGYVAPVVGCSSSYPLDDYASNGITTNASTHDIKLSDLNIHGFTSRGIIGPIGGLVTVDHVRIAFNGGAGWDFDDGHGTKSTDDALVTASYLTIEGSGCNEEYPIVHAGFPAASCFDQSSGGYGDAIGTPNTPLNVTCDHCIFRYNTQDGADLLHSFDSTIRITNSESYGNMGQQWKLGAMHLVDFEFNRTVHNCSRMSAPIAGNSTFNKYLSNFCRAAGDGFGIGTKDGGTYIYRNNSFAGYGATTYDINCSGSEANIVFQNNLHIGYKSPADGQYPGVFYYGPNCPANPFKARDHNIYYRMRTLPEGSGDDPHIAVEPVWTDETSLDAIDFHLTTASTNALGQGVADSTASALTSTSAAATNIGAYGLADGSAEPPAGSIVVTPPDDGSNSTTPPDNGTGTTTPIDSTGGTTTSPPPGDGTTTQPPPNDGTTTPPTPPHYTLKITLACTVSGTQIDCGSDNP